MTVPRERADVTRLTGCRILVALCSGWLAQLPHPGYLDASALLMQALLAESLLCCGPSHRVDTHTVCSLSEQLLKLSM